MFVTIKRPNWILSVCITLNILTSFFVSVYAIQSGNQKTSSSFSSLTHWNLNKFPKHINDEECNQIKSSIAICDPDYILKEDEQELIGKTMEQISNVAIQCSSSSNTLDFVIESNMENKKLENERDQIQIAVALVNKMQILPHMNEERTAEEFAIGLHNEWGVGSILSPSCSDEVGTGILFFLSIYDRTIYISRGSAFESTLTASRINHQIIEEMKPFLHRRMYGEAIDVGLKNLMQILEKGPASIKDQFFQYFEDYKDFILVVVASMLYLVSMWWQKRQDLQYARVRSHLSQLDRNQALALQGRYQCTSCPICLEDFEDVEAHVRNENVSPDSTADNQNEQQQQISSDQDVDLSTFVPTIGKDGLPLKLLRCGHVFCETCWTDYITTGHGNVNACPICKQDVGGQNAESTHTDNTNSDHQNQGQEVRLRTNSNVVHNRNDRYDGDYDYSYAAQRYQHERNFRLGRLRMRYPRIINHSQVQRWTNSNYRGSLVSDREFMQRNPSEIRNQRDYTTRTSRTGSNGRLSFGGGRSSGGFGGRW